ncbi:MAG: GNAT family N-acetyltransferase [Candidatus Obscuribacterales bacterium]|nr:GNAT family N-acetyltransferase [Candidatus Obscuribacterales bacterium]
MKIVELELEDETIHLQTAELLVTSFADLAPNAWPHLQSGQEEVNDSLGPGRISLVALDRQRVVGWIGAIRQYEGFTWELHPLVVHKQYRLQGVARALVAELEKKVLEYGGLTLWVATDDEVGSTSLWGQDLYPNPLEHLKNIVNLNNHPYEFYQRVGFTLVGLLPDANGYGKPDIFLSKRLREM